MITREVARDYPDFLRDESRLMGNAEAIAFPQSRGQILETLAYARTKGLPITVQGARTGIVGGAVPQGGLALNLSHMRRLTRLGRAGDGWTVTAEPGVLMAELNAALHSRLFETQGWTEAEKALLTTFSTAPEQFLPPDPTEKTASLGGAVACNSSGARSFAYGPMRSYVRELTVALTDGSVVVLRRGRDRAQGRDFTVSGRSGTLPTYVTPPVKNAAGYCTGNNLDLVDLVIGSEGTLGVVVEAELELRPLPPVVWAVTAFLPDEAKAMSLVRALRDRPAEERPAAIEFFGPTALELLRAHREDVAGLPGGADVSWSAIYVEYHGEDEETLTERMETMVGLLAGCGGSEDQTWIAMEPAELRRLQDFRHAVPEAVNRLIDLRKRAHPTITKLSTDMAVPDDRLEDVLALYHGGIAELGAEYVIFGHVGDNHLHVNLIPRDPDEYAAGKRLVAHWAHEVIKMGGTISAEHGVGKLKRELLLAMYGERAIHEMRAVKSVFDPDGLLGQGNLF